MGASVWAPTVFRGHGMSIVKEGRNFFSALFSIEALLVAAIFPLAYGGDWGELWPVSPRAVSVFGALALILVFLLNRNWKNSKGYYQIIALYCAFILYIFVSVLWSPSSIYAAYKLTEILNTNILLFLIFSFGFFRKESGRNFFLMVMVASAITLAHIYQVLSTDPLAMDERIGSYQFIGLAFGFYAAILLSGILLIKNHPVTLLIGAVLLLLCCGVLVLLGGRSGVLILLVTIALLVFVLLRPVKRDLIVFDRRRLMLLLLGVGGLGLAAMLFLMDAPPLTIVRILYPAKSILTEESRVIFVPQALSVWSANPFFGSGTGGFPIAAGYGDSLGFYPHNIFLELLAEQGLVGTGLFLGLIILLLRHFLRWAGDLEDINSFLPLVLFTGVLAASFVTGDLGMNYLHCGLGVLLSPSWRAINMTRPRLAGQVHGKRQSV